jgi:hypothetical protein
VSELVESDRARVAWRAAWIASLLSTVGWPLDLLIWWQLPDGRVTYSVAATALSGLILLGLLWRRGRTGRREASLAFLAVTCVVATGLWLSNMQFAEQAERWVPFQANKLGVLTVALLTPELGVGLLSIAIYTGSALLQWQLFDQATRARAAVGEPWAMIAYATFALVLLVQAVRRFGLERALVQSRRDAAALEQRARTLLAIRDFANTPLQTLESVVDLIALRHPAQAGEIEPARRALERLRQLNRILSEHDSRIEWRPGDESLDLRRVLEGPRPPP